MKFLIFSDSHGSTRAMFEVIDAARENLAEPLDGVLFLGDGWRDIELAQSLYPDVTFFAVAGNCDISAKLLAREYQEKLLTFDGVKILMGHGHAWGVKSGWTAAAAYARKMGADVLLFGHTHEALETSDRTGEKSLKIFNPGSISRPSDGIRSFGVLTIRRGAVLLSHGTVD